MQNWEKEIVLSNLLGLMQQTCKISGDTFHVRERDLEFYDKIAPKFGDKSFPIPVPKISPLERKRLRLSHRNLRKLYLRTCDLTGEQIISYYRPETPLTVYGEKAWWGDGWDALDYGREFDFSQPFFPQFKKLFYAVPHLSRSAIQMENSDYMNGAGHCKNCYLLFNADYCEDCYFTHDAKYSTNCVDCHDINNCELCYEGQNLERCYNTQYCTRATGCSDSYFLMDCRGCSYCIGCVNLVNKQYHIFNQPVTKEDYESYVEAFKSRDYVQEFKDKFQEYSLQFPRKYYHGHTNEEFSGNNIQQLKNSYDCYVGANLENCSYCYYVFNSANCMDHDIFGDNSEWIYNCLTTGHNCSNNICCKHNWGGSSNNQYCFLLNASTNNFGCVGLKNKKFCVFNRQYSESEYNELVPKIIEHMRQTQEWGEFFPVDISPFAYNETMAHDYFPLKQVGAEAMGYNWLEKKVPEIPSTLPEGILICEQTGKQFKLAAQELEYYERMGIPLPTWSPEARIERRLQEQLPQQLWQRQCAKTGEQLLSPYGPERPEIVYGEKAYLEALE